MPVASAPDAGFQRCFRVQGPGNEVSPPCFVSRYSEEIKAELSKKDSEIDDYRRQLGEQRKEMDILNDEIAALKDTNSRAPTQTMKNLVERLKNQVALKEKQHQVSSPQACHCCS